MSKTLISWTDETANWIVGCDRISPGCAHCYAATAANSARLQQFDQYKTVVDGKGGWNGNIEFVPKVLDDLLKGTRQRRVFAPSMSDPFHPNVKDEWLDHFMATVAMTPHITYQLLTKRPERMYEYFTLTAPKSIQDDYPCLFPEGKVSPYKDRRTKMPRDWPLPNLHIGVTVENQATANNRIPLLLQTPAAVRFVSVEPMLQEMHLNWLEINQNKHGEPEYILDCLGGKYGQPSRWHAPTVSKIDQTIIGGESGSKARPFHLEWGRSLIDQCRESGTKAFMKQVGSNAFYKGQPFKTKSRAGSDPSEWPEWARVQEFPGVK